jgi:hypothetical protein
MGGRLNKLVALNFISVFLFSLCYRSNRVIALGVLSVFLFTLGVGFVGSWRRPGAADVDFGGVIKILTWTITITSRETRPRRRHDDEVMSFEVFRKCLGNVKSKSAQSDK